MRERIEQLVEGRLLDLIVFVSKVARSNWGIRAEANALDGGSIDELNRKIWDDGYAEVSAYHRTALLHKSLFDGIHCMNPA